MSFITTILTKFYLGCNIYFTYAKQKDYHLYIKQVRVDFTLLPPSPYISFHFLNQRNIKSSKEEGLGESVRVRVRVRVEKEYLSNRESVFANRRRDFIFRFDKIGQRDRPQLHLSFFFYIFFSILFCLRTLSSCRCKFQFLLAQVS